MTAFTLRMGVGFAGGITRSDSLTVEPEFPNPTTPPTAYGQAVKLVNGLLQPLAASDTAAVINGILSRPYPSQSTTNAYGPSVPPTKNVVDVLKRGYIAIPLARGTAAKDGIVYVRNVATTGTLVGDYETTTNSGNCIAMNARFMGPADATGIVEIAYNI